MTRITPIDPALATGKIRLLLDDVQADSGTTPNLIKTFAHAPAALEGYLRFSRGLAYGVLDPKFREQIALAVAQANSCPYCLSAHTAKATTLGAGPQEIEASRAARSADEKQHAGLQLVQAIVVQRGRISPAALEKARRAGYGDGEIAEIISNVVLNIFANYMNHVARTEVDFPRVSLALNTRITA